MGKRKSFNFSPLASSPAACAFEAEPCFFPRLTLACFYFIPLPSHFGDSLKAAEVTSCLVHARKQHLRKYVQTKTFACSIITARHESKFSKTRAEKRGEGKCLFGIFLGNPIRRRCSRIPPPPPPFSTSDKLFRTQVQAAEEGGEEEGGSDNE